MTLDESRLTVFAMTAPHPSRKACEITLKFVPGGPDAITNGFGRARPSTVVASVGMLYPFPRTLSIRPRSSRQISSRRRRHLVPAPAHFPLLGPSLTLRILQLTVQLQGQKNHRSRGAVAIHPAPSSGRRLHAAG